MRHMGTIIEPDEILLAKREALRKNPNGFVCIHFDGPGPYGDGYAVYRNGDTDMIIRVLVRR